MATLTHGPILGDPSSDAIRVWGRVSDVGATFTVEYAEYSVGFPGSTVVSSAAQGSKDNQEIIQLTGLTGNTRYTYRVTVDGNTYGPYDFVSAPSTSEQDFDIYTFGDLHMSTTQRDDRDVSFTHMLQKRNENPEKFCIAIMFGDFFFRSQGTAGLYRSPETLDLLPELSTMLKYIPMNCTWDDHDFTGNNSYKDSIISNGNHNRDDVVGFWRTNFPNPAPVGDGIEWSTLLGSVLVLCPDNRYYKELSPSAQPFDASRTDEPYQFYDAKSWGDSQLEWMKSVVSDNEGSSDFLVMIVSSTMVDNLVAYGGVPLLGRDSNGIWNKNERNNFLKWLDESSKFRDVLIFTGDDHRFTYWNKKWVHDPQLNPSLDSSYPHPKHTFSKLNVHEIKTTAGEEQDNLGSVFEGDEIFRESSSDAVGYCVVKVNTSPVRSHFDIEMWARDVNSLDVNDMEQIYHTKIWSNPEVISEQAPTNQYKIVSKENVLKLCDPSFEINFASANSKWALTEPGSWQKANDAYDSKSYARVEVDYNNPNGDPSRLGSMSSVDFTEDMTAGDVYRVRFKMRYTRKPSDGGDLPSQVYFILTNRTNPSSALHTVELADVQYRDSWTSVDFTVTIPQDGTSHYVSFSFNIGSWTDFGIPHLEQFDFDQLILTKEG